MSKKSAITTDNLIQIIGKIISDLTTIQSELILYGIDPTQSTQSVKKPLKTKKRTLKINPGYPRIGRCSQCGKKTNVCRTTDPYKVEIGQALAKTENWCQDCFDHALYGI